VRPGGGDGTPPGARASRCAGDRPQPAVRAENLAIGQPRVVVDDAVLMILKLDDEIAVVLHPAHDEHIRPHAGYLGLNHLVDVHVAQLSLHLQLMRRTEGEAWNKGTEIAVETPPDEFCRGRVCRGHKSSLCAAMPHILSSKNQACESRRSNTSNGCFGALQSIISVISMQSQEISWSAPKILVRGRNDR